MPPLSILIWLPALCGVLGALIPSRLLRIPGALALVGSVAALGLAIGYIADFHSGGPALQHVTDVVWISTLGIHYKLGVSGLNVFLVGLTTLLFAAATLAANLRTEPRPPAPEALLLPLHARRVRRARRVPRPGPGAVRRVLRPDADPLLLPDRGLGHASPTASKRRSSS